MDINMFRQLFLELTHRNNTSFNDKLSCIFDISQK